LPPSRRVASWRRGPPFREVAVSVSGSVAAVALISFLAFALVGVAGVAQIWAGWIDESQGE
jgi:hypothetical protein